MYLGGPAGARPSIGFDRAADLEVGKDFTSAITERELAEHRLTRPWLVRMSSARPAAAGAAVPPGSLQHGRAGQRDKGRGIDADPHKQRGECGEGHARRDRHAMREDASS